MATPNLGLEQPVGTDSADFITVNTTNTNILDASIHGNTISINDMEIKTITLNGRALEITSPSFTFANNKTIDVEVTADIVSGANLTATVNADTSLALQDSEGENITELDAGYYTFIAKVGTPNFFELRSSSGGDEWGGLEFVVELSNDEGRLYVSSDNPGVDLIIEIDTDTKNQISSAASTGSVFGVGGLSNRLYSCDIGSDTTNELDPDTKLSISSAPSPSINPVGVGGTDTRLYEVSSTGTSIYELNPSTKLQTSNISTSKASVSGIGGILERLYVTYSSNIDDVDELDPDTKLLLSSASSPASNPNGVGGIFQRLYLVDSASDITYELDVDTKLQISNAPTPNTSPTGIGGIKSGGSSSDTEIIRISKVLFNNTEYELTDDSPFRVTGVSE